MDIWKPRFFFTALPIVSLMHNLVFCRRCSNRMCTIKMNPNHGNDHSHTRMLRSWWLLWIIKHLNKSNFSRKWNAHKKFNWTLIKKIATLRNGLDFFFSASFSSVFIEFFLFDAVLQVLCVHKFKYIYVYVYNMCIHCYDHTQEKRWKREHIQNISNKVIGAHTMHIK